MSIFRARRMAGLAVWGATAAMLVACNRADGANGSQGLLGKDGALGRAIARANGETKPDPCALLSANEAEVYVGVLAAAPYRASDGTPNVAGESCVYRGSDGRQVVIDRIERGAPEKAGAESLAATTHRAVLDVQGPWDHATWIPGGSLMITKGEAAANINVTAASSKEEDAVSIARQVAPRFDHPLDYDGATARSQRTPGTP